MTLRMQYDARHGAQGDLPPLPSPRFSETELHLKDMGFSATQIGKLYRLMDCPNGMVVFTGPTGSGKTTTLFEVLQESARCKPYRRLVTVEDPVEYPMPWAVQMEVPGARNQKETGELYGERLRVALRMAPHIILLGELRGAEVSVTAVEAAITGHQVWTTLHATDPFLVVDRLELMDPQRLNRRVFCHPRILRGIISQRLLPRLCPHCSTSQASSPEQQRLLAALATWGNPSQVRFRGLGCSHCQGSGVSGRRAVAEVVICDEALMKDFIEQGGEMARRNYRARAEADPSLLESSIALVLQGLVDPVSVEDQVDWIEPRNAGEGVVP
jgi:type II secretory ATPase GspE/PulE/Tfp pilus assembly ATPase PilB-like protein